MMATPVGTLNEAGDPVDKRPKTVMERLQDLMNEANRRKQNWLKEKKEMSRGSTINKMGGGMIKKYRKGGKVDGLATKGKTRGRMVKGRK
tara:strand:- start:1741 stop:2010 length:270 start_codon:yes stop_codon:yes gene_type:complete